MSYECDHIIVCRTFVGRDRELAFLEDRFSGESRQLLVCYGRRRVGKTTLVTEFLDRSSLDHVYFLADERGTEANARRFAVQCAEALDDVPPAAEGFDDVFEYVARRTEGEFVVVLDEFSYLVERDETIASVFQRIWDDVLADTSVSIVLLGSSISMMEEGALSHESPLYGRRTGQWKLAPLEFADVCDWFPAYSIEESIHAYAICGGVPAYVEQFDPDRSVLENVQERVLTKGTFLYEEPEFFLRQELREPATYMAILEAMAGGNTTVTEIANEIGRDAKGISRYLTNLGRLEVVDRLVPVTEPNRKQGIYVITDQFFTFWFRFVYPNRSDLERGNPTPVARSVEAGLDEHTSRAFEDVCRQAVRHPAFPVPTSRVGTWWYGEDEVDVVGIDDGEDGLVLGECKWTTAPVGRGLLADLEAKAEAVRWRGSDRTEQFVLFSKNGFTDALCEEASTRTDVSLYDLRAIADLFDVGT